MSSGDVDASMPLVAAAAATAAATNAVRFGPHIVTHQLFHRTRLSFALVNLRPLLPGHTLVCPHRVVPHLRDLLPDELADLYATAVLVQRTLGRVYGASAFNVATQDGVAAGQTVPHVHVHIIPRSTGDMDARGGGDALYEALEGDEGNVGRQLREAEARPAKRKFATDEERKDRSMEEMRAEADMLAREMDADREANDDP